MVLRLLLGGLVVSFFCLPAYRRSRHHAPWPDCRLGSRRRGHRYQPILENELACCGGNGLCGAIHSCFLDDSGWNGSVGANRWLVPLGSEASYSGAGGRRMGVWLWSCWRVSLVTHVGLMSYPIRLTASTQWWANQLIGNSLPMVVDMTDASRVGTYTGLYYLFSTLSAIAGPNVNGWIVQLTNNNYNNIMLVAPIFMGVALVMMLGVRRGEAAQTMPAPAGY